MSIRIEGSGVFADAAAANPEMDDVATVAEAVSRLGLPPAVAILVLVNDRLASMNTVLKPGDVVHVVPAVGGG